MSISSSCPPRRTEALRTTAPSCPRWSEPQAATRASVRCWPMPNSTVNEIISTSGSNCMLRASSPPSEGSALGVRHGECEPKCAATSLVGSTLAAPWSRASSPVSSVSSRPAPRADPFSPSSTKPSCSAWLSTSTGCNQPLLHRGCQQSQMESEIKRLLFAHADSDTFGIPCANTNRIIGKSYDTIIRHHS